MLLLPSSLGQTNIVQRPPYSFKDVLYDLQVGVLNSCVKRILNIKCIKHLKLKNILKIDLSPKIAFFEDHEFYTNIFSLLFAESGSKGGGGNGVP